MDIKLFEEKLLMLLVSFFFIFMIFYKPGSLGSLGSLGSKEKLTNVNVLSENSDNIIINDNGVRKKVSKVCTHMGCMVNYDKNTNKLICPCHGSEFEINGKVTEGPARDNLEVTIVNEKYKNVKNKNKLDW